MSQRKIDPATTHRRAAARHLEQCDNGDSQAAAHHVAIAQVHATLAAAAEQRTANLLSADAAGYSTSHRGLDQVIREQLDLDEI